MPTFRHDDDIFVPDPSQSRVIQAGFDSEDLSIFQYHFLQTRVFVNLKPESVPGAVKKSDLPAFAHFRAIAALRKIPGSRCESRTRPHQL